MRENERERERERVCVYVYFKFSVCLDLRSTTDMPRVGNGGLGRMVACLSANTSLPEIE